jgi:hypothetical protein
MFTNTSRFVRFSTLILSIFIASPDWASANDRLPAGSKLSPGEKLTSRNGEFSVVMQGDGNLVLYFQGTTALWNSETCGALAASCSLQEDGNLVVYGSSEGTQQAIWSSGTFGKQGVQLICQDDGNLVIYQDGKSIWSSDTAVAGNALLQVSTAFNLIVNIPEKTGKPKPNSHPLASRATESFLKPPILTRVCEDYNILRKLLRFKLLRYTKWLVRIGGKLVPFVGWGLLAYDGAVLLYDGGQWLYQELAGDDEQPNPKKGNILATATEPAEWEGITPISTGTETVALLFHTGFLCADVGLDKVLANRSQIGDWEKFRITKHDDGTISLLALSTGKYLSASSGGGEGLAADAEKIGAWEKFTPEKIENKLYLKTSCGQYLSALPKQ